MRAFLERALELLLVKFSACASLVARRGVLRKVVTTMCVLAAAGALSACVTASRFVPGGIDQVPLEMALQAVMENRVIVYATGQHRVYPEVILLVEKNGGMTFKDSRLSFTPFNVSKNELLEFLRREGRADHAREASEFRTPGGKRVAYAVPKNPLYTMTVDTEKNEFTVSRIGGSGRFGEGGIESGAPGGN